MLSLMVELVPEAIGLALSPLPLIAVVLLLLGPRGRLRGAGFAAGRVLGVLAVLAVVAFLADAIAHSADGSRTIAVIRLALGAVLIGLAAAKLRSRPRGGEEPEAPGWMRAIDAMRPARTPGAGFLATAANPKELVFAISAGVAVGSAAVAPTGLAAAVAVYVLLATSTVVVPVLAHLVYGNRVRSMLEPLRAWLVRNYAVLAAAVMLLIGALMIGKGLSGL